MMVLLWVVALCVDLGIFYGLKKSSRTAGRLWIVQAVGCWIWLLVTIFLPRRGDSDILPVMWSIYWFLTVYTAKVVFGIGLIIGALSKSAGWKRMWRFVGLALSIGVIGAMIWGATGGRRMIDVREVEYASERLPEGFDGYRIVQFSDIHVGTWGADTTFVSRLVDSINAQKPDLIVFTGDAVNRQANEILPFIPALSRLKARDGIYSIMGNHDYGMYRDWPTPEAKLADVHLLQGIQKEMGWKMLNNDHDFLVQNGDTLTIIGVENWGEPPFNQAGDIKKAYPGHDDKYHHLNDDRFKILLTHNPEHWRQVVSSTTNVDLSMAGHTHAMQMTFGSSDSRWSPSEWRYKEWGGLFTRDNASGNPVSLYVNIGAGEVGMPFRIGAEPEVTVFTLRRK